MSPELRKRHGWLYKIAIEEYWLGNDDKTKLRVSHFNKFNNTSILLGTN